MYRGTKRKEKKKVAEGRGVERTKEGGVQFLLLSCATTIPIPMKYILVCEHICYVYGVGWRGWGGVCLMRYGNERCEVLRHSHVGWMLWCVATRNQNENKNVFKCVLTTYMLLSVLMCCYYNMCVCVCVYACMCVWWWWWGHQLWHKKLSCGD
jgi:hypothetical protein